MRITLCLLLIAAVPARADFPHLFGTDIVDLFADEQPPRGTVESEPGFLAQATTDGVRLVVWNEREIQPFEFAPIQDTPLSHMGRVMADSDPPFRSVSASRQSQSGYIHPHYSASRRSPRSPAKYRTRSRQIRPRPASRRASVL